MKSNRCLLLSLFIIGLSFIGENSFAQYQSGMRWDNFQGMNAALINPSNSASQRMGWNLNLASAGAFAQNNYIFYENAKVSDLWKNELIFRGDLNDAMPMDGQTIFDYNNEDSKKWGQLSGFLTGPSFLTHFGNHHVGIFMNYRFHAAEQNLDQDLGFYTNRRLPITESVNLDPTQLSLAGWREIGFNYSTNLYLDAGIVVLGVNGKMLTAYDALGLQTPNNTVITPVSVDEIALNNIFLQGFGTSDLIRGGDAFSSSKGNGYGIDIGASFIIEEYDGDYKWKFGLAVNDIGKLTINNDVEAHLFDSNLNALIDKRNYLSAADFQTFIEQASSDFLGAPDASIEPSINSFDIALPTTIVVSADYKVMDGLYVTGAYFQRVVGNGLQLEGSNAAVIVPRYESQWFSVAAPVTSVNLEKTTVGVALRAAFLTIGTDNLGTLFRQDQLTGGDAYISLQLFPFGGGGLFGGGSSRGGRGNGCPSSHF